MAADDQATADDALDDDDLEGDVLAGDADEKQPLSLDITVDSPSACERHVTVIIPRADIARYFDDAISELMPKATVPGFRIGRAPRKLVESRFRKDMGEQVKGSLLMDTMSQVSEEQEFSAISEPDFDFGAVEIPDEGPMTFEFDLEVRPEFDVPEWKGLKLKKSSREIDEEAIEEQLAAVLSRYSTLVPVEDKAKKGDSAVVNITFAKGDEQVSAHEEITVRTLPSLSFHDCTIEEFDKLMKGAKAGDTRQTTTTISSDAEREDLRGEELAAAFEVLEIKRVELPELNQEMLGKLGDFEDETQLREAIADSLQRQLEYHQQQEIRRQITETLTESANWDLPPEMLQRQGKRELERSVMELRASGFDDQAIQQHENELRQNAMSSTATSLKEHFILERIAEEEELDAAEEDFNKEIALIAMQRSESPRRTRARLEKSGAMDSLRNQIIERKVLQLIEEHATFRKTKLKPPGGDVEAVDRAAAGAATTEIPEAKQGGDAEKLREPADHT